MKKSKRQNKIIELITNNEVETQDELADLLFKAGYNVTQATISRDIRDLKLTKIATESGKQKYIVIHNFTKDRKEKYMRVLNDAYISVAVAQNLIVVKTVEGMAMAFATALEALKVEDLVGCVAGDDTVLCVAINNEEAIKIQNSFIELFEEE